jgi:hypothetical protein
VTITFHPRGPFSLTAAATFQEAKFVLAHFGVNAGDWQVDKHPRFLADLTGNGRADIIGFGDAGVWTALSNGDGTFQPAQFVIANFGYEAGAWRVDRHPRFLASLRGKNPKGQALADIVGFGDAGVWTALSKGDGTFQTPQFVLAQFGYLLSALALTRYDRESMDAGIWRSSDAGANWTRVYQYTRNVTAQSPQPPPPAAGQLTRAPGNDHLIYAACGNTLAVSQDAGATFTNVMVTGATSSDRFFHVAIGQPSADPSLPTAIYVLAQAPCSYRSTVDSLGSGIQATSRRWPEALSAPLSQQLPVAWSFLRNRTSSCLLS